MKDCQSPESKNLRTRRRVCWCIGVLIIAFYSACIQKVNIASNTSISGLVNGSVVEGKISAMLNTGSGGSSSCSFSKLPVGFNPGTFGTHL